MLLRLSNTNILVFTLLSFSFIVLAGIVCLSWYARLAYDDFSYISKIHDLGFLQGQWYWYTNWSDRVGATLLISIFGKLARNTGGVFEYLIFSFVLLLFSLYHFIGTLPIIRNSLTHHLLVTGLIFTLLFLLTPNPSQTWFWLTGSATYLWPLIYILFFLAIYLRKSFSLTHIIIASLLIFFAATSNEITGFLLNLFLLVLIGYSLATTLNLQFNSSAPISKLVLEWLKSPQMIFLIISQLTAVFAFFILVLSPGNAIRIQTENDRGKPLIESFVQAFYQGPVLTTKIIYHQLPIVIGLFLCFSLYMSRKNTTQSKEETSIRRIITKMGIIAVLLLVFSALYPFISFLVKGSLPPGRSHVLLSFAICLAFLFGSYYFSILLNSLQGKRRFIQLSLLTIATVSMLYFSYNSFQSTVLFIRQAHLYAQAYDKMYFSLLHQKAKSTRPIIITKLPPSGQLLSAGLSEEKDYWVNQRVAAYFHLTSEIRMK